ncbi:MAG: carbohydrate kinase family protein [Oscillospiraceae bacterium]|nr:carbohydrate kinase family protein [Oscillospiraceae bacterium]
MGRVLVIGAVNMDVGGRSAAALRMADSNPGTVTTSFGGVGRNIAHNLCLLGVDTALLTVLGDDGFAAQLRENARDIGLDLSLSPTIAGERTSTYLYMLDADGDMALALSDMEIYRHMTVDFFRERMEEINTYDLVVLDANTPAESLTWLAEHCTAPLIADPVSTVKAEKLRPVLSRLYAFKPNALEASLLTGIPIEKEGDAERAADALLKMGVEQVYISLGARGIFAKNRAGESVRIPCPKVEVANATGGGDAMVAALTAALLEKRSLAEAAHYAICAGAFACTAESTIHPHMSKEVIETLRKSEENMR